MLVEEKLKWLHQELSASTLLYVNAEDQVAIPVSKVELYRSYKDGIVEEHIVANDNQDMDITNVTVYGYNPLYKHEDRYPTWNDVDNYLPALNPEWRSLFK